MASFSDIATSLRVTTQLPLDHKRFSTGELALADLGDEDNLAFTYYDNLKVFCWNEKTEWVWRQPKNIFEQNTGLLTTDFIYPNGVVYPAPGYEGKRYNFFQLIPGTDTKLLAGPNIVLTGNGSSTSPYIITSTATYTPPASDIPPLQKITESGNTGIVLRGRTAANYGDIGLNAFDISFSTLASSTIGAIGSNSFAQGTNVSAISDHSISFGTTVSNIGANSFAHGTLVSTNSKDSTIFGRNLNIDGKGNTIFGIGHAVTGTGMTVVGLASTIQAWSNGDYNNVAETVKPIFLVGNGQVDNSNSLVVTRSDAFIIRRSGVIEAPSMSIAQITAGVGKTLVTKEYLTSTVPVKGYKEYVAQVFQSTTGAPTLSNGNLPLQNELGGSVVWTRTAVGSYLGTLTGAFTIGKTIVVGCDSTLGTNVSIRYGRSSVDSVIIKTFFNDVAADSILTGESIMIRVYN